MTEVFTRRLSRWQAEQQRDAVADVYVEAYHGPAGEEYRDRQEFVRRFTDDMRRPGFDMVVASERRMTGVAYGFVLDRADDWWRNFAGEPPPQLEELTATGQVFALAELMVLPAFRRQGIATRLTDQLLLRSDAALLVAVVGPDSPDAVAATATFRAWSWNPLGELGPRPGAPHVWTRTP